MRARSDEQSEEGFALCMSWVLSKAALSVLLPECLRCQFSPWVDFAVFGSLLRNLFQKFRQLFSFRQSRQGLKIVNTQQQKF